MATVKLSKLTRSGCWRLENGEVRMDVERKTGFIRSLQFKKAGLDLFAQVRGGIPGYVGGLRIYDERDDRWYDDLRTPFRMTKVSNRAGVVRFTRHYRGAPFTVQVTMRMEQEAFVWEVAAGKRNAKVADRSLRVYFSMPLIAGWDVWAPCKFGEKTFDGMTPFEFMYVQIPYVSDQEIILPMVSHYNRALNVGYSMVEPVDENVPAAKFAFNNADKCYNWGSMRKDIRTVPVLEAVNYYIGLVGRRPMTTKVMLFFHEGDWRCGLGQVYKRWREYFDPFNDTIYRQERCYIGGSVHSSDQAERLVAMGGKYMEVHGHFQDYCDYYQDGKDRWYRIGVKETVRRKLLEARQQPVRGAGRGEPLTDRIAWEVEEYMATHTDRQIAALLGCKVEDLCHTRDDVKRRLQILADAGISCQWYFNYTDGFRPRVERQWPDSIVKDEDGNYVPSGWYMCHNMNADPRWSFGKFCYESARKIFDEYPMLDGFFLDCFRHYEIDFAHDDGTTVVNGKRAYSINHSYMDVERLIKTEIMKPRDLTSFANKPMSIRSMRYVDGQLLEGDGDMYEEKFFWASIASPLFYLWGDRTRSTDEFLRRCIVNGAWPKLVEPTDENVALYQRYLPLYDEFRRRVLCFEPDPMRVPRGSRGKLYTVGNDYVAGIMNEHVDVGDTIRYAKTPYALFRVQRGHDVARAGVMYPGDQEMRDVKFKFDGTFIAVPMQEYTNCAVVKLFVTGYGRRKIGPDIFASRPRMCMDPDSAFEDISQR
ncbi:MAG: hypothetical protein AMJ81_02070 [Phycisphaerae bacterium SM23_33]|nr:MAG: hypothetical protein AMJ81_02070 [Phycisphaerae bacterium SM23_33]